MLFSDLESEQVHFERRIKVKTLTLVLILLTTLVGAAGAQVMTNPSFERWLPDTDLTIDRVWAVHPDTTYIVYHNPNVNFSGNGWVVGWYTLSYGLDYCTSNLWKASDDNELGDSTAGLN